MKRANSLLFVTKALIAKLIKDYIDLTKPGIIRGNLLTALAGFFLASQRHPHLSVGLGLIIGLGLVIASACVSNNYLDRHLDSRMERTKDRPLVSGRINGRNALIYAAILLILGGGVLISLTNLLAFSLAIAGFLAYVALYGYYKRKSTLGTVIGSLSGALPPLVGYAAVSDRLNLAAALLFLILVFWQMPHFFAIAIFRLKDYKAAGIPILPATKGDVETKRQIIGYLVGYTISSIALYAFGFVGIPYLIGMIVICVIWLKIALDGFATKNLTKWGRQLFLFSLIAITGQCLLIGTSYLYR